MTSPIKPIKQSSIKTYYVGLLLLLTILNTDVLAQKTLRRTPKFYLGVESLYGTQAFAFTSDIAELNRLSVTQQGLNYGVVVGTNFVRTKVRKGSYASNSFVNETVNADNLAGTINIYPIQFFNKRLRTFEPYVFITANRSNVKLFGNYAPLPPSKGEPATKDGSHNGPGVPCEDGMLADPDQPFGNTQENTTTVSEESLEVPEGSDLGRIVAIQTRVGVGLEAHIQGAFHFVTFFGEVLYGLPIHQTTNNPAFDNTKVSNSVTMQVGIALGFAKPKPMKYPGSNLKYR
jgi:hypothetical protein